MLTNAPNAPDPLLVVNLADALGNDAAYAFALHLAYEADSAAGKLKDPIGRVDEVLRALRGRTNAIAVEYLLRKRRLRERQLGTGWKIETVGDHKDEKQQKLQEAAETLILREQVMTQSAEEVWGPVTMRYPEERTYDAVWNAIVRGYPDRFEGMHETCSIARLLAARLKQDGRLPPDSSPEADTALAGLLRYLWKENRESGPLKYELVEGYLQTLLEGIDDINALFTSPIKTWRIRFLQFSRDIEEQVTRLKTNLGDWKKTSKEVSAQIIETSRDFTESVRADMPEVIRFASAYILGTIIRVNQFCPYFSKFNYECLLEAYESVSYKTAYSDLYLNAGFEKIRASRDELASWRAHGV